MMHALAIRVLVGISLALLPSAAFAQASLAGQVRDTSGAVLPGVTVEAASPVLIEKVRSVVTDGSGQYRIVDLRPGSYSVTFTLPGFSTVKSDGVELSGTATTTVDIEMRVGALEETITVTGATPIVDVQSTVRQQVITQEVVATLPTGRMYANLGVLVPGVTTMNGFSQRAQDVGGALGDNMAYLMAHGSKTQDFRITENGVNIATLVRGAISGAVPNIGAAQEVTIDTASVSADLATGGPRVNFIPRDGGNLTSGFMFGAFANDALQGDNVTSDFRARGLVAQDKLLRVWDLNGGIGGPIRQDRIWYFFTARYNGAFNYVPIFENLNANNPNAWTYVPDTDNQSHVDSTWLDGQIRLTAQATPKNKFAFTWDQQHRCSCPFLTSAIRSTEASNDFRFPLQRLLRAEWSSPATNRLLFEVVVLHRDEQYILTAPEGFRSRTAPGMITVLEQGGSIPGLQYRGSAVYTDAKVANYFWRGVVSYVTGSHAVRAGVNDSVGFQRNRLYNYVPLQYVFNNGVPNLLIQFASPWGVENHLDHDFGAFVQDRWTIDRLTVTAGLRYDYFRTSFPEQPLGPGPLVPNRNLTFPAFESLNWKDISPRMGVAYDVFGDGRTALKASANRYLNGQGLNELASAENPVNALALNTPRAWSDRDRDFVADCDLTSPAANGECGPMFNPAFGNANFATATFDPKLMKGWGTRNYNWEFSAAVQHEILPRTSLEVGYFRRIFGNFPIVDNLTVSASDYDPFTLTVPSGVPSAGRQLTYYAVNPAKFGPGFPVRNFNTLDRTQKEHWNGVDVNLNSRIRDGFYVQGGLSTGRTTTDNCDVVRRVPEMLVGLPIVNNVAQNTTGVTQPIDFCHMKEDFQTQVKAVASYVVPRIDVLISGTFQNLPGTPLVANWVASNALVQQSLGRPLAGRAPNVTVNVLPPNTEYVGRLNQLDMRIGKSLQFGSRRALINVDVYNVTNSSGIINVLQTFNPAVPSVWQRPLQIMMARFVKFSAQFDF